MQSPSNRSKRYKKSIRLTGRDRDVLRQIAEFGVLSTEQIWRLCFPSLIRTRKRMRQLWQHGLVRRRVRPVHIGEGTSQLFYSVTRKGAGQTTEDRATTKSPTGRHQLSDHALEITAFRVTLTLAMRKARGATIVRWVGDRELHFRGSVRIGELTKKVPIIPDGFFVIRQGMKEFGYFLEIDRGTTDLTRMRAKFIAYLDLWHGPVAKDKLGIRSFRVLYVTQSEKRLSGLLKTMKGIVPNGLRRDVLQFTSVERFSLDNLEQIFGPIWQTIDQSGSVSACRLLPDHPPSTLPIAPGKPPVRGPDAGAR